jgi:hypothetical protein
MLEGPVMDYGFFCQAKQPMIQQQSYLPKSKILDRVLARIKEDGK